MVTALKGFILGLCIFGSILGYAPWAFGQETEPNDTCPTAQAVGAIGIPFTLDGSLDSTPETPDIDFFRLTGTPGAVIRVDLEGQATGQGTLADPVLGVFDANCNFITSNDDSGGTLNARILVVIPSDGIFILAATGYPDFSFTGGGVGTYRLSITPGSSISGRVVDADTGTPLRGDDVPFAAAVLRRCEEFGCSDVSYQYADSAGRVRFIFDDYHTGLPLESGSYQIVAFANEYRETKTAPFEFVEGEDQDVGDIPLQPLFFVQFSDIQPCGELPPEGGLCRYSVRVSNHQSVPLQGAAWSLVESFDLGSVIGFTRFQPQRPRSITLGPEESKEVHFSFAVPSTVRNGAYFCTQVFVGQGDSPFFNTVRERFLFCISKGLTGGFSALSEEEVKALRPQAEERSVILPKQQVLQKQVPKKVR